MSWHVWSAVYIGIEILVPNCWSCYNRKVSNLNERVTCLYGFESWRTEIIKPSIFYGRYCVAALASTHVVANARNSTLGNRLVQLLDDILSEQNNLERFVRLCYGTGYLEYIPVTWTTCSNTATFGTSTELWSICSASPPSTSKSTSTSNS